jgi:hypothetical protein
MNPAYGPLRVLYERFCSAVAYLEVESSQGERRIGSAFHIGQGLWVSGAHVVRNNRILEIATTVDSSDDGLTISYRHGTGRITEGPLCHPDASLDIAVMRVIGIDAPTIPIAQVNPIELPILSPALVMGYPPIPTSTEPFLVAATAEVNAVVEPYTGGGMHLVLSTMARGGLSGGVALTPGDFYGNEGTLGVITRSLVRDDLPEELGYLSVLPIEVIYDCHGLFQSKLDWYLSPDRQRLGEDLVRPREQPLE